MYDLIEFLIQLLLVKSISNRPNLRVTTLKIYYDSTYLPGMSRGDRLVDESFHVANVRMYIFFLLFDYNNKIVDVPYDNLEEF